MFCVAQTTFNVIGIHVLEIIYPIIKKNFLIIYEKLFLLKLNIIVLIFFIENRINELISNNTASNIEFPNILTIHFFQSARIYD